VTPTADLSLLAVSAFGTTAAAATAKLLPTRPNADNELLLLVVLLVIYLPKAGQFDNRAHQM
jgi:hypothetical protein